VEKKWCEETGGECGVASVVACNLGEG